MSALSTGASGHSVQHDTCLHSAPVHVDILYNMTHLSASVQHDTLVCICTTRHTCLHSAPVHVDILYNMTHLSALSTGAREHSVQHDTLVCTQHRCMWTFCTTRHTCLHSAPVHADILYNMIHVCTQHRCKWTFCTT